MASLKLQQLALGLIVAKPVYNLHGLLLLNEGTILNEKNIVMLKTWGVNQIWIEAMEGTENNKKLQPTEALKLKIEKTLAEKFSEELENPIMVEIMRVAKNLLQQKILRKKGSDEIPRFSANTRKY
jgi:hypothetical protein